MVAHTMIVNRPSMFGWTTIMASLHGRIPQRPTPSTTNQLRLMCDQGRQHHILRTTFALYSRSTSVLVADPGQGRDHRLIAQVVPLGSRLAARGQCQVHNLWETCSRHKAMPVEVVVSDKRVLVLDQWDTVAARSTGRPVPNRCHPAKIAIR